MLKWKMQSIKTIICNILSHNSILIDINIGKKHYQRMLISYAGYAVNPISCVQSLRAIINIILKMKQ